MKKAFIELKSQKLKRNYYFDNRNGIVLNSDIFINPEFCAVAKIKSEVIEAFIEIDRCDRVLTFAGTHRDLKQIKNYYCIETNKF